MPPPGSETVTPPKSVRRKNQAVSSKGVASRPAMNVGQPGAVSGVLPDTGYDFLEDSGIVLEEKGLDANAYITQVSQPNN